MVLFISVPAMPQGKITRPGTTTRASKPKPTTKPKPQKSKPPRAVNNASINTEEVLEEARQAYYEGYYDKAMTLFKKISYNAVAAYYIGEMYYVGEGVARNYAEAAKWFRKSAGQGDADAQYNLGYMYETGKGVARNYAEAVRWYRKSAEQGDVLAKDALESLNAR